MPVWPKPTRGCPVSTCTREKSCRKRSGPPKPRLRLDESLADAHAALGFIHLVYDWDGPAAEKALLRALDLNPTLAAARLHYAAYLTSQARHEEAVREIRRAVEFDPLSVRDPLVRARMSPAVHAALRRSDRARSEGPGARTQFARSPLRFRVWPTRSKVGSRRPSPICREPSDSTTARRFWRLQAHVLAVAGQKDRR